MRGPTPDFFPLLLLVLFLGVLQAKRPDRQYRFWLLGWVLVLSSIALWWWNGSHPLWINLQECLRLDILIAGTAAFALSFVVFDTSWRQSAIYMAALVLPAAIATDLIRFDYTEPIPLVLLVLIGEALAVWVATVTLKQQQPRSLNAIRILCVLGSILLMWVAVAAPRRLHAYALAEILFASGILFALLPATARASRWTTSTGFLCWGFFYIGSDLFHLHSFAGQFDFTSQIWVMPKYLVGFGMILKVFERDSAEITTLGEEYRLLYESNPHPMWIYDPATAKIFSVNDAAIQTYGYTREEFYDLSLVDMRPIEDNARTERDIVTPSNLDTQVRKHQRKDGSTFFVDITSHEVVFRGRPARFVLAVDINEREVLNQKLMYRAQHDALTGLPNRTLLEERAKQTFLRSRRDGQRAAVFSIDVDRFKQINDTYGHPVGDECLVAISIRLLSRVRKADTIARTGGEEFSLVVGGLTNNESAQKIASTLLTLFNDPLELRENSIKVSVSVGVSVFPDDGETFDDLCKHSDTALLHAKRMGGNRAVMSSDHLTAVLENATQIEAALRDAIEDGNLALVYQPIFDSNGRLRQVEALIRATDARLESVGPAKFIPIAEESGLIVPLGAWALNEACRQMAAWHREQLPEFQFAVNVSCRQLLQGGYADEVLRILEHWSVPPGLLHLELTETTLMKEFDVVAQQMTRLADAGVRFSIDDFGTGYSSLERLSELPISTVKIDRSFTRKLSAGNGPAGIVSAIVHMAKHLKLDVIAEGIETANQLNILLELGCHRFQGYLFSRPVGPEVIPAYFHPDSLHNGYFPLYLPPTAQSTKSH